MKTVKLLLCIVATQSCIPAHAGVNGDDRPSTKFDGKDLLALGGAIGAGIGV